MGIHDVLPKNGQGSHTSYQLVCELFVHSVPSVGHGIRVFNWLSFPFYRIDVSEHPDRSFVSSTVHCANQPVILQGHDDSARGLKGSHGADATCDSQVISKEKSYTTPSILRTCRWQLLIVLIKRSEEESSNSNGLAAPAEGIGVDGCPDSTTITTTKKVSG